MNNTVMETETNDWLTKVEAAELLGVTPKSIQNYVTRGELSCKRERTKSGEAMFLSRVELDEFRARRDAGVYQPLVDSQLPMKIAPQSLQLVEKDIQERLMSAVEIFIKRSATPNKLMLTIEESHEVSGLPKSHLREAIKGGSLKATKISRRWLVKRQELERFVGEL
jgi:excisionase family DNA binding protein